MKRKTKRNRQREKQRQNNYPETNKIDMCVKIN